MTYRNPDEAGMSPGEARALLFSDFVLAFSRDPECMVPCPAFHDEKDETVEFIVGDHFAGVDDTSLLSLLRFVQFCAKEDKDGTFGTKAQAWIDAQAQRYAAFHADDLCRRELEQA